MEQILILLPFIPIIAIACYACYVWGYHTGSDYTEECYRPLLTSKERDYFAAKAMQGMLSDSAYNGSGVAIEAYLIADAMIEAKKRGVKHDIR